jgi:hypothetical protein
MSVIPARHRLRVSGLRLNIAGQAEEHSEFQEGLGHVVKPGLKKKKKKIQV